MTGAVKTDTANSKENTVKEEMGMTLLICLVHSDANDGRAMHQEQIRSDDQATSEAGGSRHDARSESIGQSEAGHQKEATLDGAFLC